MRDTALDVDVVPIAPDHVEGFHAALDTVARERRFLTFLEAPPLSETRAFVLGGIGKGQPHVVALRGGTVIGWCDVQRHARPSHAHRGSLGMGVLPSHRGRGVGTRLIGAALHYAHAAGFVRVELDVHADNANAIALYEKVGFVREEVARDAVLIDDVYRDAIHMALVRRDVAKPA